MDVGEILARIRLETSVMIHFRINMYTRTKKHTQSNVDRYIGYVEKEMSVSLRVVRFHPVSASLRLAGEKKCVN